MLLTYIPTFWFWYFRIFLLLQFFFFFFFVLFVFYKVWNVSSIFTHRHFYSPLFLHQKALFWTDSVHSCSSIPIILLLVALTLLLHLLKKIVMKKFCLFEWLFDLIKLFYRRTLAVVARWSCRLTEQGLNPGSASCFSNGPNTCRLGLG